MISEDSIAAALDPSLGVAEGLFPVADAIDVWTRDPPHISVLGCPPRPRSLTFRRARRKRGRPYADWADMLFSEIYNLTREDRNSVAAIALDRRRFQTFVERLCSLFDCT